MLVPKSGKAEGMKRPPCTTSPTTTSPPLPSHTFPSPLHLPHPQTPVAINIMTLWSNVTHIYWVCLTTNLMILSIFYVVFNTVVCWHQTLCCVLWFTCGIFVQFLSFSLKKLSWIQQPVVFALCLTVSFMPGSLWGLPQRWSFAFCIILVFCVGSSSFQGPELIYLEAIGMLLPSSV